MMHALGARESSQKSGSTNAVDCLLDRLFVCLFVSLFVCFLRNGKQNVHNPRFIETGPGCTFVVPKTDDILSTARKKMAQKDVTRQNFAIGWS